jgi:hypothetical protein
MKSTKYILFLSALAIFSGCGGTQPNANTAANEKVSNADTKNNAAQNLTEVERPKSIQDKMKERGEQDAAKPILKIVEPKSDATLASSTVKVKLELSGDLKGYQPMKDMTTGMGNHIHIILDNQPYEAYYNIEDNAFELRNVADGAHTLRVFPSRPWHESYKSDGAFQMVKFTVKNGGADTTKPTTTNSGNTMANAANSNTTANSNANKVPEGKDVQSSTAGAIDASRPLLTYSRPKGEYKGADAEHIMIDFWLLNAKLTGDGGEYRVKYSVDGTEPKFIEKWNPIWLAGWAAGKHTVKLELVDKSGNLVDNGGYNSTTREIIITK